MADRAAQVLDVAGRLRDRGFTVVLVPGWETRGRGPLTTRGRVEHHTAGPRSGDSPSLRICTYGRRDLRNALCRWFVSRSGVIYLVALNVAWHAGRGVKGTNSGLSGTEAEHTGDPAEPWGERSLAAQAAISAEESREFGFDPDDVWDHREHAPGRKPDRVSIDSHSWRRRVAGDLEHQEDDDMTPEQAQQLEDVRRMAEQARDAIGRVDRFLQGTGLMKPDGSPRRNVARDLVLIRIGVRNVAAKLGLRTHSKPTSRTDA